MHGTPIIKLELDNMRQAILYSLAKYNNEIEKAVDEELKKVVENFDYENIVISIANEALKDAIESYFKYGEGRRTIEKSVNEALSKAFGNR